MAALAVPTASARTDFPAAAAGRHSGPPAIPPKVASGGPPKIGKKKGKKKKPEPQVGLTTKISVGVENRVILDTFIRELREAWKMSHSSGGCYSAFLPFKGGKLQIEVHFPPRLT